MADEVVGVRTAEERVLQDAMQPLAPAASRLFTFLQVPQPSHLLPTPAVLEEGFHCEFGHLYCPHLLPLQDLVGHCLYLIPRLTTETDSVIAAAIAKYLEEILTTMLRVNPKFSFRWTLFHVDLLVVSADPPLNDLRFPSIAFLRHLHRCLDIFNESNDFSAIEEFLCDFSNFISASLHKCGLLLTHSLLWADSGPDAASTEWSSLFGQHLFSVALAGSSLRLHCLSDATCALLRRHNDLDRALLASILNFVVLGFRLDDPEALKSVGPLVESVIGATVHNWTVRASVPASRETDLLEVNVESLFRQLLKLLIRETYRTLSQQTAPIVRVWLGCLLVELKKIGSLEGSLVEICIQDDELLWKALNCFLKLENPAISELQNCLPSRHLLFLETMKAIDYDDEFLIDSLLNADASELGLLTYLTTYLHSDPCSAATIFTSDRAAWRRLRTLLQRLHARLQRSQELATFPFNVGPLARSLALFRERTSAEAARSEARTSRGIRS